MRFRYYIALWIAKLSVIALKITKHGGTNFPGVVALKICPEFLAYVPKPLRVLCITGTNGKTSISNLMLDMLEADGKKVINNNKGANIDSGVATSFVHGTSFFGKCKGDIALLELDERTSRLIMPKIKPDYLLINNLTRDSIMRNAHPEFIANILNDYMPAETILILNGDDLITSNIAPDNERVYFGLDKLDTDVTECINLINDMQICPKCNSILKYDYLKYHHIGKAYCPNCDFKSPECDYLGTNVNLDKMTIDIKTKDGLETYRLINDSIFNIYNLVALVTYMSVLGYNNDHIKKLLENVELVKTRYDVTEVGEYRIINQLSKDKNAMGASRTFDHVSHIAGDKELILMMNCLADQEHWSENVCWLYDADFEFLKADCIKHVICSGPRCKDYYLRLLMAGVDESRITLCENELDTVNHLRLDEAKDIYVFHGTEPSSIRIANEIVGKIKDKLEGGNK